MNWEDAVRQTSEEMDIPFEVCKAAYLAQWQFIRDTIQELPLKTIPIEEFDSLRPNFNVPSLGKFYIEKNNFVKLRKAFEFINKKKQENDKGKRD